MASHCHPTFDVFFSHGRACISYMNSLGNPILVLLSAFQCKLLLIVVCIIKITAAPIFNVVRHSDPDKILPIPVDHVQNLTNAVFNYQFESVGAWKRIPV